jgi:putative endonuclease
MCHFVYILQSQTDYRYYIGYTLDIIERLDFHNSGQQRSTKNRIPFKLIYLEKYHSKKEALVREKQIKSYKGGNAFKKLINNGVAPPPLGGAHRSGR